MIEGDLKNTNESRRFLRYTNTKGEQVVLIGKQEEFHRHLVARALGIEGDVNKDEVLEVLSGLVGSDNRLGDMGMILVDSKEIATYDNSSQFGFPPEAELPARRKFTLQVLEAAKTGLKVADYT